MNEERQRMHPDVSRTQPDDTKTPPDGKRTERERRADEKERVRVKNIIFTVRFYSNNSLMYFGLLMGLIRVLKC